MDGFVILLRQFPGPDQLGIIRLFHHSFILGMDLGLVALVIEVGNDRIQRDAQCQQENQYGTANGQDLLQFKFLLFKAPGDESPGANENDW